MEIVWHDVKRQANIEKHELDFDRLNADFFPDAIIRPVTLRRYSVMGRWDDWTMEHHHRHLSAFGQRRPVRHLDAAGSRKESKEFR